jgi:hypothetical protein
MKRTSRKPSTLSESLQRHLNAYTLAATAAGVGALALTQPAEAKIVYTKANEQILGQGDRIQLDLNHDGTNDFFFRRVSSEHFTSSLLMYTKVPRNAIWGTQSTHELKLASALPAGVRVGPSKHFSSGFKGSGGSSWGKLMWRDQVCGTQTQTCTTHKFGQWGPQNTNPYLGLRFKIKGKTHYAWARVSLVNGTYTLTGYAYETVPQKPIVTGKQKGPDASIPGSGSLGALAAGASGLHSVK